MFNGKSFNEKFLLARKYYDFAHAINCTHKLTCVCACTCTCNCTRLREQYALFSFSFITATFSLRVKVFLFNCMKQGENIKSVI